jgi:hypothetical protein
MNIWTLSSHEASLAILYYTFYIFDFAVKIIAISRNNCSLPPSEPPLGLENLDLKLSGDDQFEVSIATVEHRGRGRGMAGVVPGDKRSGGRESLQRGVR